MGLGIDSKFLTLPGSDLLGRRVSIHRGWEYLHFLEMHLRVPLPAHEQVSEAEQEAWKKKLVRRLKQVRCNHAEAVVEVWAMDEHRLGLKPVFRQVWVARGEQPRAKVHLRSLYAM